MNNPKRSCGHTKIADCPMCIDQLMAAMRWSAENEGKPAMALMKVGSIMQALINRYEAAQ